MQWPHYRHISPTKCDPTPWQTMGSDQLEQSSIVWNWLARPKFSWHRLNSWKLLCLHDVHKAFQNCIWIVLFFLYARNLHKDACHAEDRWRPHNCITLQVVIHFAFSHVECSFFCGKWRVLTIFPTFISMVSLIVYYES